jgi:hypothetical protein
MEGHAKAAVNNCLISQSRQRKRAVYRGAFFLAMHGIMRRLSHVCAMPIQRSADKTAPVWGILHLALMFLQGHHVKLLPAFPAFR